MSMKLLVAAARAAARSRAERRPRQLSRFVSALATAPDDRFTRYNSPVPSTVDHTRVLAAPRTRLTTLSNGLRVATESNLLAETATVLEHMIFKGTKRRSMRALEEEIENMGGHLNAYTSREQTTYYAKVLKRDVPVALDILADILQNSSFDGDRIERERNVILREMQEVDGQLEEVIFDHLHATAYQNHSLGRTILGPEENIRSIRKKDIKNYISTHYSAPRMVITGAGAVDHDDVIKHVEQLFTSLSTNKTTAEALVAKEPAHFTGGAATFEKDVPMAHFAVTFEGAAWMDPDSIALMVMQTMLGSWNKGAGAGKHMGSGLAQRIAAADLAESYMAFNTNYTDTGLFGVYAVTSPETVEAASQVIIQEMARLAVEVEQDDVLRARNQLKSTLLLHLDGTSPIAEDIGRQILTYGRRMPLPELFARIDAVDAAAVKSVAERFIQGKEVAIAGMGPVDNLPDHSWFKERTTLKQA